MHFRRAGRAPIPHSGVRQQAPTLKLEEHHAHARLE
jgi:hypothetical protein